MLKELRDRRDVIRNFSPAWGAAVMGTGITSITSYQLGLKTLAYALLLLNLILFIVIFIIWSLRFLIYPEAVKKHLKHPVIAHFFPTVPIGALVLASNLLLVGKDLWNTGDIISWAKPLWLFGAIGTIFFGILITILVFLHTEIDMSHANCGWLIPPVGAIVVPTSGAILVPYWGSSFLSEYALLFCLLSWGIGFFYYLFLNASLIHRFIYHELPPKTLAATMWIGLGPVGVGIISLNNIVKASKYAPAFLKLFSALKGVVYLFSVAFWGFGVFWFFISFVLTLYYLFKIALPYAMSWWAFTFPLGAYTSATLMLSSSLSLGAVKAFGIFLYVLLLIFWGMTFLKTMKAAWSGALFKAH
ncbi:MAG: C4-dicarboxylate ABC transporter [Synergistetes bacterium]|nr:C4-dicarboxylate ABC transporter [Synergistota bacterium]